MDRLDEIIDSLFEDGTGAPAEDTPFVAAQEWDSLKHVQFVLAIESAFGVELSADEIARMTSRSAARKVLAAKRGDG